MNNNISDKQKKLLKQKILRAAIREESLALGGDLVAKSDWEHSGAEIKHFTEDFCYRISKANGNTQIHADTECPRIWIGELRELIRWNALCKEINDTNRIYAGSTTRRSEVAECISLKTLEQAKRLLKKNLAPMVTNIPTSADQYQTSTVAPAYLVFANTNHDSDIRDLAGFEASNDATYGRENAPYRELGRCGDFIFFTSPVTLQWPDSGAPKEGTNLESKSGKQVNVEPIIVAGAGAWVSVRLRGEEAIQAYFDDEKLILSKGGVTYSFADAVVVKKPEWLVLIEAGYTDLLKPHQRTYAKAELVPR